MTQPPVPDPSSSATADSQASLLPMLAAEVEALARTVEERCRTIDALTRRLAAIEPAPAPTLAPTPDPDAGHRLAEQARRHRLEITLLHVLYASWSRGPAPGVPSFADQIAVLDTTDLFDGPWYLVTYPDVAASPMSAQEHYVRSGAFEGRNPGPRFNTMDYYSANPDIAQAGWPALVHYALRGQVDGRLTAPRP